MNKFKYGICCSLFLLLGACIEKTEEISEKAFLNELPFTSFNLSTMSDFEPTTNNWKIVGDVYVDRTKRKTIVEKPGEGVLANIPNKGNNNHLFTNFEHGDIAIEFDVMMPVKSNSGIYFQGLYEVQLFDSWGEKKIKYSDIGGIYQRWDNNKEEGKKGYEGHAPKINASKSPGLWQHFKIIFHAPRFNDSGVKIKNAEFKEVWLNGYLLHKNVVVKGATRAAPFSKEKPKGPLMIQGDHGPVALKNIKYKLYGDSKVTIEKLTLKEYEGTYDLVSEIDSLKTVREIKTDTLSSTMITDEKLVHTLIYTGNIKVPVAGDYFFNYNLNNGCKGVFIVGKDTIDKGIVSFTKTETPFKLLYTKSKRFTKGFSLLVEGPNIEKHPLHKNKIAKAKKNKYPKLSINVIDEPITQRSFLNHKGEKRTHCISVGMPQQIHYGYDLALGSLLKVWEGDFLDVTQMWHSRGTGQIASPKGFLISTHGDLDFSFLEDKTSIWPKTVTEANTVKQLGYEFNSSDIPIFKHEINGVVITNTFIPNEKSRALKRVISVDSDKGIWHKIAEGISIKKLPDDTFIINGENYFIYYDKDNSFYPVIRNINGKEELLVKIPAGKQDFNYSIIW